MSLMVSDNWLGHSDETARGAGGRGRFASTLPASLGDQRDGLACAQHDPPHRAAADALGGVPQFRLRCQSAAAFVAIGEQVAHQHVAPPGVRFGEHAHRRGRRGKAVATLRRQRAGGGCRWGASAAGRRSLRQTWLAPPCLRISVPLRREARMVSPPSPGAQYMCRTGQLLTPQRRSPHSVVE